MELKIHGNVQDLTGQRFGRLVAIEPTETRYRGSVVWLCECDCGNTNKVSANSLLHGGSSSCGCLWRESTLTQKISKNNTSGHKGVYWDKKRKKWVAEIMFKGKKHNLGRFEYIQDAIEARKQGEEEIFEPMLEKHKEKQK